ncbi:MAG TPA: DUF6445 family protein [Steroidobacteraceae bacterium]|nr:DUF6445 family protein [Steroidobacteraceae bacterium]
MSAWLDSAGRFFNPEPQIGVSQIDREQLCVVVDNALSNPEGLIDWAAAQAFEPPRDYPYPGLVCPAPADLTQRVADHFALHARSRLQARRTQTATVRLSLVTKPPDQLDPIQWQCHRDRLAKEPEKVVYAAMVLYLYRNPALGGTTFYRPRQSAEQTSRMFIDSEALSRAEFSARYGLQAGYMVDSNAYFERIGRVPAVWNRMIYYDGGLFHSGDINEPSLLSADPRAGRLTLNGFFVCTRNKR